MRARGRSHRVLARLAAVLCACALTWGCQTAKESPEGVPESTYVYKRAGAHDLTLTLDYPPDWRAQDTRPAILFFFGGGWNRGDVAQFEPQARYFAARGMVCARADYRVVAESALPQRSVDDALDAMRWLRAHASSLGIDPHRIVAAGGSAGGLLAACTFFVPDAADSVSHRPDALLLYNPRLTAATRGTPGIDELQRRSISPAYLAREADRMVPTLIVVGSKDLLTLRLARRFARDVEKLNGPVEIETVAGQLHGFFNYMPWLASTTERADAFFQSIGYLQPGPEVPLPSEDALERPEERDSS